MDELEASLRVTDAERSDVDLQLRQAHADGRLTLEELDERSGRCWSAKTRGDLEAIVRDLLPVRPPPRPLRAPDAPPPATVRRPVLAGAAVAVAAVVAGGALVLPVVTADDGASVFGSRVVQVGADEDRVEVGTLFGSVRVVVPDDARVRTSGTVVFGSMNCSRACDGSGTREVVVQARGGFGSVTVVRDGDAANGD